jgi:hypothetical protein
MDKKEFLKKWIPEAEKITHIIGINYMYRAMGDDLDSLVAWAAENVFRGAKGDNRVFVEEKAEEPLDSGCNSYNTRKSSIEKEEPKVVEWYPTPELRWNENSGGVDLQQKWINHDSAEERWRDVPNG